MLVSTAWMLAGLGLIGGSPGTTTLPNFRIYDVPLGAPALDMVVLPLDANPTPDAAVLLRTAPTEVGFLTLRGSGTGRVTPKDLQLLSQLGYTNTPTITADDFNADGLADLAIAACDGPQVFLGDGDLTYVGSGGLPTAGGSQHGLDFTDIDGDGFVDSGLLVDDIGDWFIDVGINDGSGSFGGGVNFLFASGSPSSEAHLLFADVDNDGVASAFNVGGTGLTTSGEVDGPFESTLLVSSPGGTLREVIAADLNGDAFLDLAVASVSAAGVHVLLNDGAGNFPSSTLFQTGRRPEAVAAGDVTGDGLVDLVVPNRRDDDTAVLAGDGGGGFQLAGKLPSGAEPVRVGLADLDFDTDVDILVASSTGMVLRVYLNQLVE